MRAYTPMGCGLGYVDFVIKVYFANVHPKFPDGGKLTQILDSLQLGDTIDVKGPLGEWVFNTDITLPVGIPKPPYTTFTHTPTGDKTPFDTIGFIAGGSGITPVLQVSHALVADKDSKISISILFANQTIDDILCRTSWIAREGPARQGLHRRCAAFDAVRTPRASSTRTWCAGPPRRREDHDLHVRPAAQSTLPASRTSKIPTRVEDALLLEPQPKWLLRILGGVGTCLMSGVGGQGRQLFMRIIRRLSARSRICRPACICGEGESVTIATS